MPEKRGAMVLRTVYLTAELDTELRQMAKTRGMTPGDLTRYYISRGLLEAEVREGPSLAKVLAERHAALGGAAPEAPTEPGAPRAIGRADVEHYEAAMVLAVARAMPGRPYDTLAHRPRQRRLDAAVRIVQALMADEGVRARWVALARMRGR